MSYLFLSLSVLCYGIWAVLLKKSEESIGVMWTCFFSNVAAIPVVVVIGSLNKWVIPFKLSASIPAILTCALGFGGVIFFLLSLRYFSASVVTTITALYPVISVLIFALLGESISIKQYAGMTIALLGVALIVA